MQLLASIEQSIRRVGFEPLIWIGGLLLLGLLEPGTGGHVSICPLALIGLEFCPGCGLGRSVSLLFHGELVDSIQAHWFGIPAVVVLLAHSLSLGIRNWKRSALY
jgi:hypothetical protein